MRIPFCLITLLMFCGEGIGEQPLPQVERLQSSPVLRHLKKNPMRAPAETAAERTLGEMYVPEGFRVELVLAEPQVHQPIAFTFDERGRMWVAEAYSYPQKRPEAEGLDKIVVFDDRDGDGRFETRKVFAEGLNLVSGLEVGYGGVWVGAAPELLFIADQNQDDVPDGPPRVLLDGFGYQDTHECLNSFLWGPDGWLYGNQGVFNLAHIGKPGAGRAERVELRAGVWRYHPVRKEFEVFAHGGSNQWGLDYDERGQVFMTHCRSYWGRGLTTHVIQGGHFWNQANANYAPFIIANPPAEFPEFKNYLLASARYDHGAGGAGPRGSDAIYGGHSHVGTMIYLGDNWPDEFRGHLFTHNLHGHQINHQINRRLGSGFETVHAGLDQFFCSDPKYVAVDLQYGPDGAVYVIDWYDQQHCHNPNTERWDRGNGRVYRLQYDPSYKPVKTDLAAMTDQQLAELHAHKNEWHVRTARRLLSERALKRAVEAGAVGVLKRFAAADGKPDQRLRALWTLHGVGLLTDELLQQTLGAQEEFVRGWAIQLAAEDRQVAPGLIRRMEELAAKDPSPVVRLFLASASQRVSEVAAWRMIEALAGRKEDAEDRNLPSLIWQGLALQMAGAGVGLGGRSGGELSGDSMASSRLERAFRIAERTPIEKVSDSIYWYAASLGGEGLERSIAQVGRVEGDALRRRLAAIELALGSAAGATMPGAWKEVRTKLYEHSDARVRQQAERVSAVFGDSTMFPRLREVLGNPEADLAARKHAFTVLSRARDRESVPVFVRLLDESEFRGQTIPLLGRFESEEVPEALLSRFERLSPIERGAALNALTSRAAFARRLLDAVGSGRLKRDQLTAFHIRQLSELRDPEIDERVGATWGRIQQTPAEKTAQINRFEKVFNEAPLWAFDGGAGRLHFQKLCAQCHRLGNDGTQLGPELTGAGRNGIRYYLENVIDPNAVIGTDFQMTSIDTRQGEVIAGLIANETQSTITLRTAAGERILPKTEIAQRSTAEISLMPEGLLEGLSEREQIELLKFLTSN